MKNSDKEKIEQIKITREKAHSYYLKKSRVYQSFVEMKKNTYKNGELSKKQKEFIAIGISIVMNCTGILQKQITLLEFRPDYFYFVNFFKMKTS